MSMTSDDVDDTPVPTMRSSGPFHRVVAVTHANKWIWLISARKTCACLVVKFSERQALDNQTGRTGRLIMEREMAGVLSSGAAAATKKHVDKSVVFVADGKTYSHTHTGNVERALGKIIRKCDMCCWRSIQLCENRRHSHDQRIMYGEHTPGVELAGHSHLENYALDCGRFASTCFWRHFR